MPRIAFWLMLVIAVLYAGYDLVTDFMEVGEPERVYLRAVREYDPALKPAVDRYFEDGKILRYEFREILKQRDRSIIWEDR